MPLGPIVSLDSVAVDWGPFTVQVHIDTHNGPPRCVGLEIRSFRDDKDRRHRALPGGLAEVTAGQVRSLPIARIVNEAMQGLEGLYDLVIDQDPGHREEMERRRGLVEQRGRRYDLKHFERVAELYQAAILTGSPTAEVARKLRISRSAAAKQISRCRNEFGLLPPATQGRAIAAPKRAASGKRVK